MAKMGGNVYTHAFAPDTPFQLKYVDQEWGPNEIPLFRQQKVLIERSCSSSSPLNIRDEMLGLYLCILRMGCTCDVGLGTELGGS